MISAIVVAQVAAPAMRAAKFGTMIVTGVDSPIIRSQPSRRSLSARPHSGRPRRCSGPTWNRTAYEWRRSRSPDGSLPVLPLTRSVLLSATGMSSKRTARGRRSFALPASRGSHEDARQARDGRRASNHPSIQLDHPGAPLGETTIAGPERTPGYRRWTVSTDGQFDAGASDRSLSHRDQK